MAKESKAIDAAASPQRICRRSLRLFLRPSQLLTLPLAYKRLTRVVRVVTGQRYAFVARGDPLKKPDVENLDGFFERGRFQTQKFIAYIPVGSRVLEFGGGVGRLAENLVSRCTEVISVDTDPLMMQYGRMLAPTVTFRLPHEVPAVPRFDVIYSIAVFFHLSFEEKLQAIEYVHQRLVDGGLFILDLKLGESPQSATAESGFTNVESEEAFIAAVRPYFEIERIDLFNVGLLLRKRARE